ncbi:MAG: Arm DNA-binding domain-containing protein [Croceibacterium sp.]
MTKRTVDGAAPGPRNSLIWDDEVSGFGVKVTPAGRKVYVYQYRLALPGQARGTAPRRYTIGQLGEWTPDQARDRAKELRSLIEKGIDPLDDKRDRINATEEAKRTAAEKVRVESELKFETIAEKWLTHLLTENKSEGYYKTSRWAVRHYLAPQFIGKPI